jgi:hypothetical protein
MTVARRTPEPTAFRPSSLRNFSPRLSKLALLVATTLAALATFEAVLRFLVEDSTEVLLMRGRDFHSRYFSPDVDIGVVRRPNLDIRFRFPERPSGSIHFQTNNLGLRRSTETPPPKPPGVRRILLLGDSQMDGAVDNHETAAFRVEAKLNRRHGLWEVLNAATGSYSPYQSYLWYRKFGLDLDPDLILFSVFLGNDFAELLVDDRPHLEWDPDEGLKRKPTSDKFLARMHVDQSPISTATRMRSALLQRSSLFARLSLLLSRDRPVAAGEVAAAYSACIGCTGQSLGQAHWFDRASRLAESIGALGELLSELKRETGDRVVALSIPTRLQIEPHRDRERIEQTRRLLGLGTDETLEDDLAKALRRLCRDLGIPLIDPDRALTDAAHSGSLYHDTDWHLNARGHAVVAQVVYDQLREYELLLDAPTR